MAELIANSIDNNGAGYADQKIENNTGVEQVSSALEGYNPNDGTYTYKQGTKWKQSGADFKPIDTGDKELDEINIGYNQALANYLTDPAMRSAMYKYDPELGGHGLSDSRDEMDQFMQQEYGKSGYDTDVNTTSSEMAKFNRMDNQTRLGRIVADGIPRLTGRAVFSIAGAVTSAVRIQLMAWTSPVFQLFDTVKNGIPTAPRKVDNPLLDFWDAYIGMDAMTNYNDKFVNLWQHNIGEDTYASEAVEKSRQEHPMAWKSLSSSQNLVELCDNLGYTVGAAVAARINPALLGGMAGGQLTSAIEKHMIDEDTNEWETWQQMLPIVGAAIGTSIMKANIPGPLGVLIKMLMGGIASASSEAETEAVHAKQEYLQSKSQILKNEINRRKRLLNEYYSSAASDAKTEEELQEIKQKHQDQLRVLDWEYTMSMNQAVSSAGEMESPIRLMNYAILTISNIIQFGKLFTGGAKTFIAQGRMALSKEAKAAAQAAYKQEMKDAGLNVSKRFNTWKNRDVIKANAIEEYQKRTGKAAFDESGKLSGAAMAWLGIKLPLSEGTEEIMQAAAANYGKRTAEVNTDRYYERLASIDAVNPDDYFSQVRSLAPFQKAESSILDAAAYLMGPNLSFLGGKAYDATKPNSTYEGWGAFANTFRSESAWSEFTAGALMGALGIPFLRSARFSRSTGEKNADGTIATDQHWRSPIYIEGGIFNEIKSARKKKEMLGKLAARLNQATTEKEREQMLKRFSYIAHHMQYEEDKDGVSHGIGMSVNPEFRYTWQNAEDADILKSVELFQNTGQIDLLRAMVNSQRGYETAAELRTLQAITSDLDEKGSKVGPYAEFDLHDIEENASDAEKQALADNVKRMKEKIIKNTDKILHAIDTYNSARQELVFESQQGLTDDQLNCLTWYRVRLAQFDKRTKEMFEKHKEDLEGLNSKIGDFFKEQKEEADINIDTLKSAMENETDEGKKKEMEVKMQMLRHAKSVLDMAQDEWTDRWTRMQQESDPMKQARILFAGNASADPIGMSRARKPWYMPSKQWAKRVKEGMLPAAQRRQALMGQRLDFIGLDSQATAGVLDSIIDDLSNPTSAEDISAALKDKFSDDAKRKEFAIALNDMRQCQAAIVRYKDLYQFYKDNPYAMTLRQAQEKARIEEEAKKEDVKAQESDLAKAKSVAEMYDIIRDKIVKGEDIASINTALDNLVKADNKIAKQLLKNQEYVRAFAAALDSIKLSNEDIKKITNDDIHASDQTFIPVLKEIAIDAARECDSVEAMHKYILSKIDEITSSTDAFVDYIFNKKLLHKSISKEELTASLNLSSSQFTSKGGYWQRDANNKAQNIDRLKKFLPEVVRIVDKRIKDSGFNKSKYAFGETTSSFPVEKVQMEVAKSLDREVDNEANDVINKMTQFGDFQLSSDNTSAQPQGSQSQSQAQPKEARTENQAKIMMPNDIINGETVYLVVDKMGQNGKSEIFGLDADKIAYNGIPNILMAVKRSDGYWFIGRMTPKPDQIDDFLQTTLVQTILGNAAASDGAYVSNRTAKFIRQDSGEINIRINDENDNTQEQKDEDEDLDKYEKFDSIDEKTEQDEETEQAEKTEQGEENIQQYLNRVHPYQGRESDVAEDEEVEDETPAEDEARKNAQDEAQSQQNKSVWRPIMSFFNLARRQNGETIRNNRVKNANGDTIVSNPSESWCGKFFNTLEKLNVFKTVDEVSRDEAGAIKAGEDVYFIIDKMGQNGKSEIFGLDADEIAFRGTPHIFMAVKRGNSYQCFGTMPTAPNKLSQYGQSSFVDMVRKNAEASSGAYVHSQTAKVKGLHSGLVEIQDEENTLDKVYGRLADVRIVAQGYNNKYAFQQADFGVNMDKAKNGSLYAVVTDNATGVDRLMPCRLAHFNSQDQGKYKDTATWKAVENGLSGLISSAKGEDIEQAKASATTYYNQLNSTLALFGYGIHLDLIEKNGGRSIVVSKVAWENGGPKTLVINGEVQYQKGKDGQFVLDGSNNKIPLHERSVAYIDVSDSAALDKLRSELMNLNPPFRVKLSDISNQKIGTLIKEGIITTNIADGGGLCTRGGFVEVDASSMQVADNSQQQQSQARQQPQQAQQTAQNGQVEEHELAGHKFTINRSNGELVWKKWNGANYVDVKVTGREAEVISKMLNGEMMYAVADDAFGHNDKVVFYPDMTDPDGSYMITIGNDIKADRQSEKFTDYEYRHGAYIYHRVTLAEKFLKEQMQMSLEDLKAGLQAAKSKGGEAFLSYVDTLSSAVVKANQEALYENISNEDIQSALGFELGEGYEMAIVELRQRKLAMRQKAEEEARAQEEAKAQETAEMQERINKPVDEEKFLQKVRKSLKLKKTEEILEDIVFKDGVHLICYDSIANGVDYEQFNAKGEKIEWNRKYLANYHKGTVVYEHGEKSKDTEQESKEAEHENKVSDETIDEEEGFDVSRDESEDEQATTDTMSQENRGGERESEAALEEESDDEALSIVAIQDRSKPKADYTKEISALRKSVPYLTRDEAVMIVDGLIETGRKGVLAQGKFRDGLMVLSREGVQGTAFHEAFHGVFRTALNDEQRAALLKDAKRLAKTELNSEAEEWLADAFRDYMIDQVYPKSWTQRIKDFFRSLFHLVSMPHYRRSPICRRIFSDINRGSYREAGSQFTLTTLREERIKEYREMGLDTAAIELIEDSKNSYAARTAEERSMLAEAGISEEAFNLLTPESRDEVIRCL